MPLPFIDPANLTPEQTEIYDVIAGGARGGVRGPFRVLLHSPALTARLEKVGSYLRYESSLPARARELAIMMVSSHHRCDAEWTSHLKIALDSGVPEALLADIAAGREPRFDLDADRIVHHLVREVIANKGLSEDVLEPALATFGQAGTVELTVVVGYYALLAMVLVSYGVPPVAGDGEAPWRDN